MTNEISRAIHKVNYNFIAKNYTNPAMWQRKWTIYNYDGIKVDLVLSMIFTQDRTIWMRCEGRTNGRGEDQGFYITKVEHPERTQEQLEASLYSTIKKILTKFEEREIKEMAIYQEAVKKDEEEKELVKKKAIAYLDENGVTDTKIREPYIERQILEADEGKHEADLLDKLKERIRPEWFAMLALQFQKEKEYAKTQKVSRALIRQLREEMSLVDFLEMTE